MPVVAVTEGIKCLYVRRRLWKGVVAYYKDGAEPAFGTSLCSCLADSKTEWPNVSGTCSLGIKKDL